MLTIPTQRLSSVEIVLISSHTNTNSNIRDQHSHLTYTSFFCTSYLQTEIKLVCFPPRTIRTTHLSFTLHIQLPAFSQVCQLFGCLFWWACKLFPGRKRATCALTSRACVHMITARQADNMVVVVSRDFRRAPFSIPIDCRTFYGTLMNINSNPKDYCNTSFAGGGFSHTSKVRKKRSASALD